MRSTRLLVSALLLSASLAGCSDDPGSRPAGLPSPTPSAAAAGLDPAGRALSVRLTGEGIETAERGVPLGTAFEEAEPVLRGALGRPTLDTGEQEVFGDYGTCPGSRLRALEFGGGALHVLFGDVDGDGMTMYQWSLTGRGRPAEVPKASALLGSGATFEIAVGDPVAQLRSGTRGADLDVRPGDEVVPPSFRLTDRSPGLFGTLTGATEADTVRSVVAGQPCGE